ncbi:hypothetical protein CBS147331_7492 [Penicillium roqueforti]|nr:hypothetical protein CBS147331_7492 [Penicillium roqueforti]
MDLYQSSTVSRKLWDRADTYFLNTCGFRISEIVIKNPKSLTVRFGGILRRKLRYNYRALRYLAPKSPGESKLKAAQIFPEIDHTTTSYTFRSDQQYVCAGDVRALLCLTKLLDSLFRQPPTFKIGHDKSSLLKGVQQAVAQILPSIPKSPLSAEDLPRGKATNPFAGIDVPFHSSFMKDGIPAFRQFLYSHIACNYVDPQRLIRRYVPNLTARLFDIDKDYFEVTNSLTGSPVLTKVLNQWDEIHAETEDPARVVQLLKGLQEKSVAWGLLVAYGLVYLGIAVVRFIAAIRGTLILLIFRKSLELQKSDMAPLTLMSTDVERIIQGLHYVHESFVSLFTFSVALWLLKRQLSVRAIAPIVVSVCSMLVIATFGKSISNAQKRWVEAVEKRLSVTTEILTSMKGIKMSGLSKYSSALLQGLRETELVVSLTMRRFLAVGIGLSFTTPTLSSMVGFAVYTALASHHGNTLLAATAFPALSIFNLLSSPLSILIQSLPGVIAMLACFERIGNFLQCDARNDTRYLMDSATTSVEKIPSVEPRPVSSRESFSITLGRDLIRIVDGRFWRTTDSEPILQDLNLQIKCETLTAGVGPSGCVNSAFDLRTGVAYCSQQPWLRNDTVRNNIIAGMPYNEAWYNTSLARAIYSRRPLLLLDDSLSGIDNLSIQHIFDRLLGADGLIKQTGTTAILATHKMIITLGGDTTVLERKSHADAMKNSEKPIGPGKLPIEAPISISQNPFAFALEARFETAASDPRDPRKGELGAYKYHFASLGFRKLGLAVFLVVSYVFFSSFPQIWLEWWTASNVDHPNNRLGYWIGVYAVFGFLAVFSLITASWLMLCNMVKNSAKSLHLELVQTVERAVASVFTSTDPGITVNRFSQDMALIDMELPMAFANTIISFTTCVAQLVIIAVSSRYLGATIPFILGVCILTQRLSIRKSRQLRFFDIEAKSPLYTEFIELLNGLHVVRAFDMQKEFEQQLATALDASQKLFYLLLCAQQWLGLVLNLVNLGLALILVGVTTATRGLSGGFLGVALINLKSFGPSLSELVDVWCTLQNSLAAVERVKPFSEETPKEYTD